MFLFFAGMNKFVHNESFNIKPLSMTFVLRIHFKSMNFLSVCTLLLQSLSHTKLMFSMCLPGVNNNFFVLCPHCICAV